MPNFVSIKQPAVILGVSKILLNLQYWTLAITHLRILNVSRLLDNDSIDYRNLVIKTNCFEQST